MEDFDLKIYLRLMIKNRVWIISVVLLTLVLSLIIKLVFTKAPVPEYSTERTIDVSGVLFNDKTLPNISYSNKELEELEIVASRGINRKKEDFTIIYTNPTPSSIKVVIKSSNENETKLFSEAIQNQIYQEIIKKNQKNTEEIYNKLDGYYKSTIAGKDGKVNIEEIKLISSNPNESNKIKPVDIIAGEKITSDLKKRLTEAENVLAKALEDKKNLTDRLNSVTTNINSFDSNIKEYNLLLGALKSKDNGKNNQNDQLIKNQILYFEENLVLFNSYKTYYSNAKTLAKAEIKQVNEMVTSANKQVILQTNELSKNKVTLDGRIAYHDSQVKLIKQLNNILYDNEILNSKITTSPIEIKKINKMDTRIRSIILSVWLAFIVVFCLMLFKEYFSTKNKK